MANKKKISQVLIESQKSRTQIFGSLWNTGVRKISDITEYCAMGALMCESGLITELEHIDGGLVAPSDQVLFAYFMGNDVDQKLDNLACNSCVNKEYLIDNSKAYSNNNPFRVNFVTSYIIHMNDYHHMTFEQIGKVIEKLGF